MAKSNAPLFGFIELQFAAMSKGSMITGFASLPNHFNDAAIVEQLLNRISQSSATFNQPWDEFNLNLAYRFSNELQSL